MREGEEQIAPELPAGSYMYGATTFYRSGSKISINTYSELINLVSLVQNANQRSKCKIEVGWT